MELHVLGVQILEGNKGRFLEIVLVEEREGFKKMAVVFKVGKRRVAYVAVGPEDEEVVSLTTFCLANPSSLGEGLLVLFSWHYINRVNRVIITDLKRIVNGGWGAGLNV